MHVYACRFCYNYDFNELTPQSQRKSITVVLI